MLGSSGANSKKSKGRAKWQRHFRDNYEVKCTKNITTELLLETCDELSDSVFTATWD
jgi:hypothetical protein